MSRVKRGVTAHSRHLKVIKAAKGSRGRQKNTFRAAIQRVEKSGQYAYRDRKTKKRTFRGLNYSILINKLNASGYDLNRKMLADLAVREPDSFKALIEQVKKS